jgi:hypothetical protein
MGQNSYTYDNSLLLKDAGLVAADAGATVSSAAKIVDLGTGRVDAKVVIDVSAIEVATGDEAYKLKLQGSSSASFASGIVELACLELGDSTVTGNSADSGTGRYELPFTTEQAGTIYQYVRMYTDVAGTIATGINYTAWIARV